MASRSNMRSWLSAERLGQDVLRLRDGSLRAVLECTVAVATPSRLLDLLSTLPYPVQLVIQARRASVPDDEPVWTRLWASHAFLMSRLAGLDTAFLRRVMVALPWDAQEGGDGSTLLNERVDEARRRLDQENLDPVQLSGRGLEAAAVLEAVHEGRCEVRTAGLLARPLVITRLPERLRADSLDALDCGYDLSFHLKPTSQRDQVELSAYATLWTETREALDAATERAEALLAAQGIRARRPYLQAEPALVSGMPLCLDMAGGRRVLTVEQLRSAGSPAGARQADEHRLLYGVDPGTQQPLTLDRFALANPHALVLGEPGDRARVLTLESTRARLAGRHVHVIETAGLYKNAISALDGQILAPTAFDPFSVYVRGGGLESQAQALLAMIELAASGLTPGARSAVEDAIAFSYAAHGYTREGDNAGLTPPTLAEIATTLARRAPRSTECSEAELDALVKKLARYVAGDGRRLLGRRPSPRRLARLSIHDLSALPREDQPVAALLSLDRLWRLLPSKHPSVVVLDGVDRILHGAAGQLLTQLMSGVSERRVGLTLASHDAAGVLRGPVREVALGAGMTVLLRQSPQAASLLAEVFHLTPPEQSWLLSAGDGEGLLLTQGRRLPFKAIASDEELQLVNQRGSR